MTITGRLISPYNGLAIAAIVDANAIPMKFITRSIASSLVLNGFMVF